MVKSPFAMDINRTIRMNDGVNIPMFGLGVYMNEEGRRCVELIKFALSNGYRHIDTAAFYGNEHSVALGIRESGLDRSQVFVTSKIWSTDGGYQGTIDHVNNTLRRTQLEYFDLYLIHAPQGGQVPECYRALHDLKRKGLIKSVGVSNFGVHHLQALAEKGLPIPSNNQIELHPWQQKRELVKYCKDNGIVLKSG
ncbi:hypothetical protein ACOME3_001086 [Neoechinorhynchus agilis]